MRFIRVLVVAAIFAVGSICFALFSGKVGGCGSDDSVTDDSVVKTISNVKNSSNIGANVANVENNAKVVNSISNDTFSPQQVKKIEQVVHNYLVQNPQVMVEVMQELQTQMRVEEQKRIGIIKELALKHKKEIFDTKAPGRAVVGSNNPKVIIAEFFGYQCPICRLSAPAIEKILQDNKDLQMIFIPWPFEGNVDIYAVQTSLAAERQGQGKFFAVHKGLLALSGILTNEQVDQLAIKSGLNMTKLRQDRDDKVIVNGIKANFKLSQDLGLIGTPSFFITNAEQTKMRLFPGKTSFEEIQQAIKEVR